MRQTPKESRAEAAPRFGGSTGASGLWRTIACVLGLGLAGVSAPTVGAAQEAGAAASLAETPKFSLIPANYNSTVFVTLPSGTLKLENGRFQPPAEAQAHLLQPPFNAFANPAGDAAADKAYRAIFSMFHDVEPPPPNLWRLFLPATGESVVLLEQLKRPGLAIPTRAAIEEQCDAGAADEAFALFCLTRKLAGAQASPAFAPIETSAGPAFLIFDADGFDRGVLRRLDCRSAGGGSPQAVDCPQIFALLARDLAVFERFRTLFPRLSPVKDDLKPSLDAALRNDAFFVVDFLDPEALLDKMRVRALGDSALERDALIYKMRRLDGGEGAPIPPYEFASEALIAYARPFENAETRLLRTPLRDVRAEAEVVGAGGLREAFIPNGAEGFAAPGWLYDRLASKAMQAQAQAGAFCREGGAGSRILFGASDLRSAFAQPGAVPSSRPALRVDAWKAPNVARERLYAAACAAPTVSTARPIVLPASLESRNYGELCGSEDEAYAKVDKVAGNYRLSPVIQPQALWSAAAPFVLTNPEEGVYMQSRPVSLREFADHLTTFEGCAAFAKEGGGFAETFAVCSARGALMRQPTPSASQIQMDQLQYFYGAIGAALRESGAADPELREPRTLDACLQPPAAAEGEESYKARARLCSLRFFMAARAVDRLDGQTPPPPKNQKPEDQKDAAANAAAAGDEDPMRAIVTARSAAAQPPRPALPTYVFTACALDGEQTRIPVQAAQLCTALQRYVRAAFTPEEGGGSWGAAPVTMTSPGDVERYRVWRAAAGSGDRPEAARRCEAQLAVPRAEDLVRASASVAAIRGQLLPEMRAAMDLPNEGASQGLYRAAVLASARRLPLAARPEVSIAGLPTGFRQITRAEPEGGVAIARIPAFPAATPEQGFGLSPSGVIRYFDDMERFGFCLQCAEPREFLWPVWSDAARDAVLWSPPEGKSAGGDPATGFRLMLKLQPPQEEQTPKGN